VTRPKREGQKLLRQALGAAANGMGPEARGQRERTLVDKWRSEERVGRGEWRRARRTEHSRILEHVLATNEAPAVVEHSAAGGDDQDEVCRCARRVYYQCSRRASLAASVGSVDSNVYPFSSQQPPKRRSRSAFSNVLEQPDTRTEYVAPFYSMRAMASASPEMHNDRQRGRVAC
jgi:hypothetical protein